VRSTYAWVNIKQRNNDIINSATIDSQLPWGPSEFHNWAPPPFGGGARGIWTHGFALAKQVLYPLSHVSNLTEPLKHSHLWTPRRKPITQAVTGWATTMEKRAGRPSVVSVGGIHPPYLPGPLCTVLFCTTLSLNWYAKNCTYFWGNVRFQYMSTLYNFKSGWTYLPHKHPLFPYGEKICNPFFRHLKYIHTGHYCYL
jgi:hypothetical protein